MKPKFHRVSSLASLLVVIAFSTSANAQLQWDANNTGAAQTDGAGTWTGANQWWDGAANVTWNSGTPDSANIGNGGAGGAISLGGNVTAGTITFGNHTGTYTIQGTAHTLTVNTGITINTNSNVTFRGTAASPNGLTLTGAGGLTMNGTGIVTMRENITTSYTGTTTINSGVVLLNGGSKPTGNFYLNGGMLTDYFQQTGVFSSGLGTGANQIRIHGASGFGAGNGTSTWRIGTAGSVLVWGASGEGAATGHFNPTEFKLRNSAADNNGPTIFGNPNIDNRLDLNSGSRTFNVHLGSGNIGGSRATIDDGIQDTGGLGVLNKNGGGMLIIGGTTATWGGATNVNNGILFLGGNSEANIGGGSARNITIASGAGIQFNALNNATLNRIVETSDTIMVMTGTTSNNLDFSSSTGATLPNAFLGNYATNGAKAEYSGTITPGSAGYKLGALGSSGNLGIVGTNKITGANTLTVGQTGASARVTLSGANDFTGQTVISSGSRLILGDNLSLQNSALNVGSAGGNIAFNAGTAAATITGNSVVTSPTFGGLIGSRNLSSVFTNTASNNESNQTANLITGFTLNVANGNTFTYSGAIGGFGTGTSNNNGGGTGGASTLTKSGLGTQILSGASTYTGATLISGGTLQIGAGGTTGALSTSSTITNNANLTFNRSDAITQGTHFAASIGGSGTVTQAGGATSVLTLSGTNTYAGGTLINGGIVRANSADALGGGDVTIGSGGVRLQVADGVTVANDIIINSGAGVSGRGVIENTGSGSATLSGGTITINAGAAAGGHFASTGGGTLILNHAINSASVTISQRLGTVVYGNASSSFANMTVTGVAKLGVTNGLATNATVNIGASAAGTLDLAGFNQQLVGITKATLGNAATIGNSSTTSDSLLTTTGTSTYDGVIQDVIGSGTQKVALRVNGGALTLGGANTYTGTTTVDSGKLLINGSTSSTSLVTVNGGTLGGTGTIGGAITLNSGGTLSPGASIESLASGSNTWNGGSTFVFEFSTDGSTGAAGTAWDLLSITGGLDLSGATIGSPINFDLVTMANASTSGLLGAWDPNANATWSAFLTTTTGYTAFASDKFSINTSAFQNTLNGSFSVVQNGNSLDLVYTVVPEPNAAALIGALGTLLLFRRRR